MNLAVTCGIIAGLNPGLEMVLAKVPIRISAIQLALMLLLFAPLWFLNILIINTVLSFILSIGEWLFPTSLYEPRKTLTVLLAFIPTLLELYWLTSKLGFDAGYWGAFSW